MVVASLGSTPDIITMKDVNLDVLIENLPGGYYVVADPAYSLLEQLLIPYTGSNCKDKANDIFNFYLSQLCIRVKMAFRLLMSKFRIFRAPMSLTLTILVRLLRLPFVLTIL